MTRGTIAIITDNSVVSSIEFNGNMYPSRHGHGRDVALRLNKVRTVKDFEKMIKDFNEKNHHYEDEKLIFEDVGHSSLDFSNNYYGVWFSDYVYIKNITENTIELTNNNGRKFSLEPLQKARLYFGNVEKIY